MAEQEMTLYKPIQADYKIKKCVQSGKLYIKEKGIYSDKRYVPELEIISKKYQQAFKDAVVDGIEALG